ncbi:hypothetical protein BDV59DRAFT_174226 [Aspergillus ambiguus]|uniref:uncharacterized protein n=1 Tax=Aspergillus ambiguus TaxID=176160 RepID=UPI003CCCBE87
MDDVRESRRLVRIYSWDVEERIPPQSDAHQLGKALIEDRGDHETLTAPWRKFFENQELNQDDRDPLMEAISVESTKLREKWLIFRNNCPKEDRLDLSKSEPTTEGVFDMVNEMMVSWGAKREKGRRGRAIKLFHNFCCKLDSHSSLMKLLPEGNVYVSVFSGTLGAIIKASVNHEAIAEGLASSLCQISEHIIRCKAKLELFKTKAMLELVVDLYAHVFLYLSSVMDWIMEKRHRRLLDSFNENFSKRFSNEVSNISHKAEEIRRRAEIGSWAETRSIRLDVEEVKRDVRLGLEGTARNLAERRYFEDQMIREAQEAQEYREQSRIMWAQLSGFVKNMLAAGAMESIQGNKTVYIPLQLSLVEPRIMDVSTTESRWTSYTVSLNSKGLEDFFHRDRLRFMVEHTEPVMINQDTLLSLSEWSASVTRRVLWLKGPDIEAEEIDNPLSMLAAKIIDMAQRSGVPVISYFCEIRRNEPLRPGNTKEVQATLSLLYALIRQLVELLLPEFDAASDLSESRFDRLDGTLKSWEHAIALLRDLIHLGPDPVFCVVDGFHWLDDPSSYWHLKALLEVLLGGKLKVLFTTAGRAACLDDAISCSDIVEVEVDGYDCENTELDAQFIVNR